MRLPILIIRYSLIATPVLKIDHVAVRKRSITFNWTDDLGTSSSKYFVTYTTYDDEGRGEMVSLEAFKPMITIKGLTPFTQYKFSVDREIAMAGTGATIIRTTMPDGEWPIFLPLKYMNTQITPS